MSKIVAIVGRPNVGKSTLFNRFVESRKAIVDDVSGVTRDRIYGKCNWNGIDFSVIDTGGYVAHSEDVFEEQIRKQVHLAIEEADLVLFMTDVESGITDLDEAMASILRRSAKNVIPVVNKVDNNDRIPEAQEFYALGLGEIYCISSMTGSGTGDLLDEVVRLLPQAREEEEQGLLPHFTVVGRPNVGKSSFINALVGEERNIVTDIAGTTRDAIHARYHKFGFDFIIVDTAGLRKRAKVKEDIEFYSVLRSVRAIEQADVCLLMLDAERGIESQDMSILNLILKNGKGMVLLVNKWDLVEKDHTTMNTFRKDILERMAPFTDVPIVFISSLNKQRIHKALETAMQVYQNRTRKIKTSELNDTMLKVVENYPPPSWKGKNIKIKYCIQLPSRTPGFVFFSNLPQYIKEPYHRYIENQLREKFNFTGVPIQIFFRQK
jgi:GTP-binding protein